MTTRIRAFLGCICALVTIVLQTQPAARGPVTHAAGLLHPIVAFSAQRSTGGGEIATLTTLPSLSRGPAEALAVNEAGTVIVGTSWDRQDLLHAVKWTLQDGAWVISSLPMPPNSNCAVARGINNWGATAGNRYPASTSRAVLWPPSGGSTLLGCDTDTGAATMYAISANAEVVVGRSNGAAVWQPGSCKVQLPVLTAGGSAGASAVNGDGTIVGGSASSSTSNVPVRWTLVSGAWQIQQLDARQGHVAGANAAGDLAGYVIVPCGTSSCQRAAIWPRTGSTRTLSTLGGADSWVRDINSSGEVVGASTTSQGVNTGYFWSPVSDRMIQLPVKGGWAAANAVSDVRPDGTRLVVGMNSQSAAVVWVVKNP